MFQQLGLVVTSSRTLSPVKEIGHLGTCFTSNLGRPFFPGPKDRGEGREHRRTGGDFFSYIIQYAKPSRKSKMYFLSALLEKPFLLKQYFLYKLCHEHSAKITVLLSMLITLVCTLQTVSCFSPAKMEFIKK